MESMESNHDFLLKRIADAKQALSDMIDENFDVLEYLVDEDHPNFVEEVLGVFLKDLHELINGFRKIWTINERTELLNKIKSMSDRIGCVIIRNDADQLSTLPSDGRYLGSWTKGLEDLLEHYNSFRIGIEHYLEGLKKAKHSNLRVSTPLHEQIDVMRKSFVDKGVLTQKFLRIENLKDKDDDEDFLEETYALFFEHSGALITSIGKKLDRKNVNYDQILYMLDQLKCYSASNGAIKIKSAAKEMAKLCKEKSLDSAKESFIQLKADYDSFKEKFESFIKLLRIAERVCKIPRDSPEEWLYFTS